MSNLTLQELNLAVITDQEAEMMVGGHGDLTTPSGVSSRFPNNTDVPSATMDGQPNFAPHQSDVIAENIESFYDKVGKNPNVEIG